jgi:two-component system, sensor histidine kinase YesM
VCLSKFQWAKIKRKTLQKRLLRLFLLISIIPVIIFGLVSFGISANIIQQMSSTYGLTMMDRVNTDLENLFKLAFRLGNVASQSPSIQEALRTDFQSDAQRYSMDLSASADLQYSMYYYEDVFGIDVVGNNGGEYKSHYRSFIQGTLMQEPWYKTIIEAGKPVWFGPHAGSFATETIGEDLITCGIPVIDKASGRPMGVVLVDILVSKIQDIIQARLGKNGYFVILGENNQLISEAIPASALPIDFTDLSKQLSDTAPDSVQTIDYNGALIVNKTSTLTNWKLVGIMPKSELESNSAFLGLIIGVLIISIALTALLVAWRLSDRISSPIRQMTKLMKLVEEGDLHITMGPNTDDEIGQLGKSFNLMISKLNELMNRVYLEQRNLRKAELRALQAQINPHFLYNTLDSIIWLTRQKRNEEVITLVTALTKLFRIGISRGAEIIPMSNEIEHVRSYLTIQNIRYTSKFTYEIDVNENLMNFLTLKLILQPLVENAIYHGIKMKKESGAIRITGEEKEDCILLKVTDTGIGMTQNVVDELHKLLNNEEDKSSISSYGVRNVHQRIRIFFGNEYGLSFTSQYGEGTTVTIKLPKLLEGETNVKSDPG